ncbi:MAG: ATP-binding protein [Hydrococcus sp. Prado102]|jgi:signal transduction histidine kinase|nr:ATP-binding protein [Hydrococcus sp. Prado102]
MTDFDRALQSILLIDDNPDDRLLAIRELHRENPQVQVIEVSNLDSLNREIETGNFDLVITDYELNWTNGIEVLARMKARDRLLPVVMFTNSGSQEVAVEAMKTGLNDYVLKSPKHRIRLSQAVRSAWENSQMRRKAIELEIRLQFLLDRLDIGVFRASLDGRLLEFNNGFMRILKLNSLEQAEAFFREHFVFDEVDRTSGEQWKREVQMRCPDGSIVWVEIGETLTRLSSGDVVDGLLTDISEKKQAEQTLERCVRERTAQLETTNSELQMFAESISHDLRAPIRQIGNYVGFLEQHLRSTFIDDTSLQYLQRIASLSEQANSIIEDLLEYSRSGSFELQFEMVDMDRLVREVRQIFSSEISQREIVWEIEPLPQVRGDRTLLSQVWQNLIDNALKYTRPRQRTEIAIGSRSGEGETIFFIQDNGVGFNMQSYNLLFQLFGRLHPSDEFDGTGIGLANAKRIINRHNGRIWAESVVDRGATFYFSLPEN